jgi:hypothetical protein
MYKRIGLLGTDVEVTINLSGASSEISILRAETVQGVEPLRSAIDPATGEMLWHRLQAPHGFEAVIAFGRRVEPWNVSIEGRESEATSRVAVPENGRERGFSLAPQ